jgi:hypothetical protein
VSRPSCFPVAPAVGALQHLRQLKYLHPASCTTIFSQEFPAQLQTLIFTSKMEALTQVEKKTVQYNLGIQWSELNVNKFLMLGTSIYLAESSIYYPFELVKTRMQVSKVAIS